jgi:hypothetical protein
LRLPQLETAGDEKGGLQIALHLFEALGEFTALPLGVKVILNGGVSKKFPSVTLVGVAAGVLLAEVQLKWLLAEYPSATLEVHGDDT